jgi:hypothetical protein
LLPGVLGWTTSTISSRAVSGSITTVNVCVPVGVIDANKLEALLTTIVVALELPANDDVKVVS